MPQPAAETPVKNPKRASAIALLAIVLGLAIALGQHLMHPPAPKGQGGTMPNEVPVYAMKKYRPAVDTSVQVADLLARIQSGQGTYETYRDLVNAYDLGQKYEEGASFFQDLASQQPKDPLPLVGQGMLEVARGNYSDGEKPFEKALGLAPDLPEAYKGLSETALFQEDLPKALSYAEQALENSRKQQRTALEADILGNIAQILLLQKDFVRAQAYQEQAMTRHQALQSPRDIAIDYATLARIYSGRGLAAEAENAFQQALALSEEQQDFFLQARIHAFWAAHCQQANDNEGFMRELQAGNAALRSLGAKLPDGTNEE